MIVVDHIKLNVFPLFGKGQLIGKGVRLDFSNGSEMALLEDLSAENRTRYIMELIEVSDSNWAWGGYLDQKQQYFTRLGFKQMISEHRFVHLGLDIYQQAGTSIFAPLDGEVVTRENEIGDGNYGGKLVIRHTVNDMIFYSLYGHLDPSTLISNGVLVKQGECIGELGSNLVNGGYSPHVHLQVITEKGLKTAWLDKGYCALNQTIYIQKYCPNPSFLFVR